MGTLPGGYTTGAEHRATSPVEYCLKLTFSTLFRGE